MKLIWVLSGVIVMVTWSDQASACTMLFPTQNCLDYASTMANAESSNTLTVVIKTPRKQSSDLVFGLNKDQEFDSQPPIVPSEPKQKVVKVAAKKAPVILPKKHYTRHYAKRPTIYKKKIKHRKMPVHVTTKQRGPSVWSKLKSAFSR